MTRCQPEPSPGRNWRGLAALLLLLAPHTIPSARSQPPAEALDGPVPGRVLRVIDGDTISVRAQIWLGQHIEVSVRLAGIDAPELRSACRTERYRAARARNFLQQRIAGTTIFLHDIRRGKYAGRVVASVRGPGGEFLNQVMLDHGLADLSTRRHRRIRRANCNLSQYGGGSRYDGDSRLIRHRLAPQFQR
ncbi:MAG: thermonuclease family protein [Hyphomicrobiaceae bacterium]